MTLEDLKLGPAGEKLRRALARRGIDDFSLSSLAARPLAFFGGLPGVGKSSVGKLERALIAHGYPPLRRHHDGVATRTTYVRIRGVGPDGVERTELLRVRPGQVVRSRYAYTKVSPNIDGVG